MQVSAGALVHMLKGMAQMPADIAVVVLTVGLLLIYVEMNRPGLVVAGAVGLLGVLFAIASLGRLELNAAATVMVGTGVVLLAVGVVRNTAWLVAVAATVALVLGLDHLVVGPGAMRVHMGTAVVCGVIVGAGTSILTRIARRARTNKGLD